MPAALVLMRLVLAIGTALADTTIDWAAQLDALGKGDATALARVRRLVTGQLARMRAYETREGWDDLAQEIIIRVWRAHRDGKIRDARALPGLVRTMTRNAVIDALRKRQPDLEKEEGEIERTHAGAADSLDPGTQLALRNALGQLSERHREVVDRIYLQGLSYDEAAKDLGRPRGAQRVSLDGDGRDRMVISPVGRRLPGIRRTSHGGGPESPIWSSFVQIG